MGRKHLVIPDTQVKPDVPLDHIIALSHYIVAKKPDVIVMIGDWFDLPSLSSYDRGTKKGEGRRLVSCRMMPLSWSDSVGQYMTS